MNKLKHMNDETPVLSQKDLMEIAKFIETIKYPYLKSLMDVMYLDYVKYSRIGTVAECLSYKECSKLSPYDFIQSYKDLLKSCKDEIEYVKKENEILRNNSENRRKQRKKSLPKKQDDTKS